MNGLILVGTGAVAAYKMSAASTGKTDRVGEHDVLSDLLTTEGTSDVMSKMAGCWKRITTEELYNNRGFSSVFGQTGETRKANTLRYLINHDKANTTGELNTESKKKLLGQAEKAVQYSRQAEHLFCQMANPPDAQLELKKAKVHCEDLLYLYAQRDKLIASAMDESSQSNPNKIELLSKTEEQLNIIKRRIEKAESSFKQELNGYLNKDAYSKVGYKELMKQFGLSVSVSQDASKYQIEDFIRYYAFKAKLISDPAFGVRVQDEFRKYIFCTSVGHLDAGEKLAHQYGKWIQDLLDESSLGDIDSRSGNISQYFMQTVYNLLNDGKPNFSLGRLCIGAINPPQNIEAPDFGGDEACPGSHYLTKKGKQIVLNIVAYYKEISDIVSSDGSKRLLDPLDDAKRKTLLWNLLGGTHSEMYNKTKKGIFYRIDEQLKGFKNKTESAMHSKLVGFENSRNGEVSPRDRFVERLAPNPYVASLGNNPYTYSPNNANHRQRLNVLQSIANRCGLNDLEFPERQDPAKQNQLRRLKMNYQRVIARIDLASQHLYTDYFKEILGPKLHPEFLKIQINAVHDNEQVDAVLESPWREEVPDDLANECIESARSRKEMVRQRKFNMVLGNDYDVNNHLNSYVNTVEKLRDTLNASALCKDMKDILAGLSDLTEVIKFYKNIIDEKPDGKQIGLLATPTKLLTLAELAVLDTKDQVHQLCARYKQLKETYGANNIALDPKNFKECEREIFELSVLETLFKFLDDQSKANPENAKQPGFNVEVLVNSAVETCLAKLDSMKYIELATNNINALNSKRLLFQLTKQKDLLIQFATVFSTASTEGSAEQQELKEFKSSIATVIADLEAQCNKLVYAKDNGESNKKFNAICSDLNAWLLKIFLNQDQQAIDNEFQHELENGKKIPLMQPQFAKSCRENYRELRNADFSCADWGKCSQVHKTLLKNLLNTQSSIVSDVTLYLGSLFSDGFAYNPKAQEISHFQQLLASSETALTDMLASLSAMGYLHQQLLGQYGNLIKGAEQLFAINTTAALRSKLLMAILNHNTGSKFLGELTNNEKKLYLKSLYNSKLYNYPRSTSNAIPKMDLDDENNPNLSNFELHAPHLFADPVLVMGQLLGCLNAANDAEPMRDEPLTDYVVSTQTMIDEIEQESKILHGLLAANTKALQQFKAGIDEVSTKLKGDDKLTVTKDTIDRCNELLGYFKVEHDVPVANTSKLGTVDKVKESSRQLIDDVGRGVFSYLENVKVTKVNTLRLPDLYHDWFMNLFNKLGEKFTEKFTEQMYVEKCHPVKLEFEKDHKEICNVGLSGEIALFEESAVDMDINDNEQIEREVVENIKGITAHKRLSTIERPFDWKTLKSVYQLCSEDKTVEEKALIRKYLNAFQYKKIEHGLAKFYISASNNLPKLTAHITSLCKLDESLGMRKATLLESESDKREMARFVIASDNYLKNVTNSIKEWKSLLLKSDHAWLVRPRHEALEEEYKRYFEWFTQSYLKLDILNSGAFGSARDQIQFTVILDYLKAYREVSKDQITLANIELIKRFYRSPQDISPDQLSEIEKVLCNIDAFLEGKTSSSVMTGFLTGIKSIWGNITKWFIKKDDDVQIQAIKHKLQELYNQFYMEVIKRGNETVLSLAEQNLRLDKIKQVFKGISEPEYADLLTAFAEVKNHQEMSAFFINNAKRFSLDGAVDSTMLSLLIEGLKAKFPKDDEIQQTNVVFVKKLISDRRVIENELELENLVGEIDSVIASNVVNDAAIELEKEVVNDPV